MRFISPRRRRGFTMIEMLVVFVVFGAVMMISVRSVGDTLRRDRLAKTAVVLSADLEQAFATAAQQRAPVRIRIYTDTSQRVVVGTRGDTTTKYRMRRLKDGDFGVDYMSTNRDSLDIMPTGMASDTLSLTIGVFTKGGAKYDKTIRVTRGGLVRIGKQ